MKKNTIELINRAVSCHYKIMLNCELNFECFCPKAFILFRWDLLHRKYTVNFLWNKKIEATRFELATSASLTRRSSQAEPRLVISCRSQDSKVIILWDDAFCQYAFKNIFAVKIM